MDDLVTPWGVRVDGYPIIVWAHEERAAVRLAMEWLDYVQHIGQAEGAAERVRAEQLGEPRPWREVEPDWQTNEPTAWEAARQRAARMRKLLGVKQWWLAIAIRGD
jgi:hypothetical protein